jgi:hypothetical protein
MLRATAARTCPPPRPALCASDSHRRPVGPRRWEPRPIRRRATAGWPSTRAGPGTALPHLGSSPESGPLLPRNFPPSAGPTVARRPYLASTCKPPPTTARLPGSAPPVLPPPRGSAASEAGRVRGPSAGRAAREVPADRRTGWAEAPAGPLAGACVSPRPPGVALPSGGPIGSRSGPPPPRGPCAPPPSRPTDRRSSPRAAPLPDDAPASPAPPRLRAASRPLRPLARPWRPFPR